MDPLPEELLKELKAEGASGMDIPKSQIKEASGDQEAPLEEAALKDSTLGEGTILTLENTTPAEVEEAGKIEAEAAAEVEEAGKIEAEAAADAQTVKAQDWGPLAVDVSTFSSAFSGLQLQELEGIFQCPEYPNILVEKEYEIPEDDSEDPVESTEPEKNRCD